MDIDNSLVTDAGKFIDMPAEEFKEWIVSCHMTVGQCNNYVFALSSIFNTLVTQKDALLKVYEKEKSEEVLDTIKGIYAELIKIEEKAVCLTERAKELLEKGV